MPALLCSWESEEKLESSNVSDISFPMPSYLRHCRSESTPDLAAKGAGTFAEQTRLPTRQSRDRGAISNPLDLPARNQKPRRLAPLEGPLKDRLRATENVLAGEAKQRRRTPYVSSPAETLAAVEKLDAELDDIRSGPPSSADRASGNLLGKLGPLKKMSRTSQGFHRSSSIPSLPSSDKMATTLPSLRTGPDHGRVRASRIHAERLQVPRQLSRSSSTMIKDLVEKNASKKKSSTVSEASTSPGLSRCSSKSSSRQSSPWDSPLLGLPWVFPGEKDDKARTAPQPKCLRQLSVELNCPLDIVKEARTIFLQHACNSIGELDGALFRREFNAFLLERVKQSGHTFTNEEIEKKQDDAWKEADRDCNGCVNFEEFTLWWSSWGFEQFLLATPDQLASWKLAREYGLSAVEVEGVRAQFVKFDTDGSGQIEFDEFRKLLNTLLKVPKKLGLPDSRVEQFWQEVDLDGSGSVCFEEFFIWYTKYFDLKGTATDISPIEQFYKSVRQQ